MKIRSNPEVRRFGIREWMGGGWWAALVLSLLMIFGGRSGTVDAPAQASTRSADSVAQMTERLRTNSPQKAALERDLRASARELARTRDALKAAKERVAILQESYEGLDDQFSQMTELVRSSALSARPASAPLGTQPGTQLGAVPIPVEAIFTYQSAPTKGARTSQ